MRFVRFTRNVALSLWTHSEGDDIEVLRTFRRGETYLVGEVSPVPEDGLTVIEFSNLGFAETPDNAWVWDKSIHLWVRLGVAPPKN